MSMVSGVYKGSVYALNSKATFTPGKGKSRKSKRKSSPKASVMFGIALHHLGYKQKLGVSQYTLMATCLAKLGVIKPEGVSDKAFAKENMQFLIDHTPKAVSKPVAEKVFVKPVSSQTLKPLGFVKTDEFLQSFEWRKLRMQALKKHGSRCQCCGATPADGKRMNVDHIKPRKFFPELALELDNLQILCEDCNHGKGNWDQTDWR